MVIDTWIGDVDPTLGFLHVPDSGMARGAVVICPPLGHEQVIAYRGMRYLGQELEKIGLAALRFDYVGEGDASGESASADAVERWIQTIERVVQYVRDAGAEQVALVGLTSGGLLAAEAAGRIPGLAGLVLWDPALSGRRFLRRQKSIHDMTVERDDQPHDLVPLLSLTLHAASAAWIEAAEITAAGLAATQLPTLLIGREADAGSSATRKLLAGLPSNVEYRSVTRQEEFLDVASSIAEIPGDTVAGITTWLGGRFTETALPIVPTVASEATVGTTSDGSSIVERIGRFGPHAIFTIESSVNGGAHGLVLMQPAAAEHRIGPGRFQVRAARELAARGYRAVRFDRRISGETTEVVLTEPNMVLAKEWVSDAEELALGFGAGIPIALVGLCSGAWTSARIAEPTAARLTVMLDINYYRTGPLRPGQYAERARMDQHGEPQLGKVRGRIREIIPLWLWRLVSFTEAFNDPTRLLTPPSRVPGSTMALLLTPEDDGVLESNKGADAVARLRARGADIRITSYDFGDHALFGEAIRAAMLADTIALIEATIPAPASVPVS